MDCSVVHQALSFSKSGTTIARRERSACCPPVTNSAMSKAFVLTSAHRWLYWGRDVLESDPRGNDCRSFLRSGDGTSTRLSRANAGYVRTVLDMKSSKVNGLVADSSPIVLVARALHDVGPTDQDLSSVPSRIHDLDSPSTGCPDARPET